MSLRKLELSVGAFVLLGLMAVVYLAVQSGAGKFLSAQHYSVTARFTNVGGLKPGSQVLIAGVAIGQVASVALDEQYGATVEVRLPRRVKLPADTIAAIRTSGLLGAKFVALLPGSDERSIPEGGVIVDTESSVDIETLLSRFAFGEAGAGEDKK